MSKVVTAVIHNWSIVFKTDHRLFVGMTGDKLSRSVTRRPPYISHLSYEDRLEKLDMFSCFAVFEVIFFYLFIMLKALTNLHTGQFFAQLSSVSSECFSSQKQKYHPG